MQKKLVLIVLLASLLLGGCATPRDVYAEPDDVYANASDRAEDLARRMETSTPAPSSPPTTAPTTSSTAPSKSRPARQATGRNTTGSRALNYFFSGVIQVLLSLALLLLLYL
jgi:hypothetical protein